MPPCTSPRSPRNAELLCTGLPGCSVYRPYQARRPEDWIWLNGGGFPMPPCTSLHSRRNAGCYYIEQLDYSTLRPNLARRPEDFLVPACGISSTPCHNRQWLFDAGSAYQDNDLHQTATRHSWYPMQHESQYNSVPSHCRNDLTRWYRVGRSIRHPSLVVSVFFFGLPTPLPSTAVPP